MWERTRRTKAVLLVLLAAVGAVTAAYSQVFRGTITGVVTDQMGAAVASASVEIKNLDTGTPAGGRGGGTAGGAPQLLAAGLIGPVRVVVEVKAAAV